MGSLPYNVRVNVNVPFPALVAGAAGIKVTKQNGIWTIAPDYTVYAQSSTIGDPANSYTLVWNALTGVFTLVNPIAAAAGTSQIIVAPGDVTVRPTDTLIILNKTSSQVTNVNLPASATKIGAVKIVDWKGDSGSFPITVVPHGSELFNAAKTSWPISGAGASATFDPIITGLGYAV